MTVDVELDLKREPGLKADVNQTEIPIHEIEIQKQTLPPRGLDKGFAFFESK